MEGYLGETVFDAKDTEFKDFTPSDWAMYFIEGYGQIDGGHHKQWVIDQVSRILKGTSVIIKQASWDNGQKEWRMVLDEPSEEYKEWVIEMRNGEDRPNTYFYDCGIVP
jgi:hypothetical protein